MLVHPILIAAAMAKANPTIERMKRASEQMHTYQRRPLFSRAEASRLRRRLIIPGPTAISQVVLPEADLMSQATHGPNGSKQSPPLVGDYPPPSYQEAISMQSIPKDTETNQGIESIEETRKQSLAEGFFEGKHGVSLKWATAILCLILVILLFVIYRCCQAEGKATVPKTTMS